MSNTNAVVTVQTGTVWASGDSSFFVGTGGPQAYDPFFGSFADLVSSAGLDAEPLDDQLWNVGASDQVVFLIAVQNRGADALYDLRLRDLVPTGFISPADDAWVSVLDGAGSALNVTGDLFSSDGLQLLDPVAPYDPDSGANVVLLAFTLEAASSLQTPLAVLQNTAEVLGYGTAPGQADLAGVLSASTQVASAAIRVESAADQAVTTLRSGEQASYDVTLTLPGGTAGDLRIDEILPKTGDVGFNLLSAAIVRVGADIQGSAAPVIGADGSIAFGTLTDLRQGLESAADQIVVRLTVGGAGATAGLGTLQTRVSALDPNAPGTRWSADVINTLGLAAPNAAPTIIGALAGQSMLDTAQLHPFAALTLADPDPGQVETLTIQLSQPALASLAGSGLPAANGANYVLTGTADALQAIMRNLSLVSAAGRSGLETLTLTLDDRAGGVAHDALTTVAITVPPPPPAPTITGAISGQTLVNTAQLTPFGALTLTAPDPARTETLIIHLSQPSFGQLSGGGVWSGDGTDYWLNGTVAQLQAAARSLVFAASPGHTGTETLSLTLTDFAGSTASDATTQISLVNPPNGPPTISGASGGQTATNTMQVRPFAALGLADPDPGQLETLTFTLSQPALGSLSGAGLTKVNGASYRLTGSVDQVQAAARALLFQPTAGASGIETVTLAVDDGAGGVATDATTQVTVLPSAPTSAGIEHFPLGTASVTTSTAGGTTTVAQVETYGGPVTYLQSQFIYDGTEPLAIVAQSPNMFIKNVAGSTAVQLLSGQNVVDAGHGSNFLLAGTGNDVFFLDGRQLEDTWDTIVGFHQNDIATLWGFRAGVSQFHWDESAGVAGYTGRTLRADFTGSGHVDASLTFAGASAADTAGYEMTTGSVGGNDYMMIRAVA